MEIYRNLACQLRYALIVVCLIISNYSLISQEVDLTLTTTYSSLPDLDANKVRTDNKLFASMVLNDFSFDRYNVRLKLTIEGNGVTISSSNLYNYRNFTLIPGVPKVITSFELGEYFNPQSLDFNGMDKNSYLENGTLPEGNYKLCFTVVDGQSDGANEISNTECDFLSVSYIEAPIIVSDLNSVLDFKKVDWTHDLNLEGEVNYTFEIYEFKGAKGNDMITYQKPKVIIKTSQEKTINISKQLPDLSKDKLYAFVVKVENKKGFNYLFKNQGYSKPLYFQEIRRSVACTEEIVFNVITLPDGSQLLEASVPGCDQLVAAFNINGIYSNIVPYVEGTGYTATIICANEDDIPCTYTATYGNPSCVIGSPCPNANGCPAFYGYNCECIEECVTVSVRESYDEDGALTLTPAVETSGGPPGLPVGCLENNTVSWSNGEIGNSITPENPNAAYGFTIVCDDGCTYCGTYNKRAGCWPGRICSDGDPCTKNDKLDANCDCVGEHISNCDPNDSNSECGGTLDINVYVDNSGGNFLTADFSGISADLCSTGSTQYVWNNDFDNNQDYFYIVGGGSVSLLIQCENGCSYTAQIDLNDCTPGQPCEDDNNPSTIEYYDENCLCVTFDCPDFDGDGIPDECDDDQSCNGTVNIETDLPNQQLYVNIDEITCDGSITYLWSSGATTASIPFLNENATYSVTVTCSNGCQYTDTSEGDDEDCIVGAECETDKSCNGLGTINENCECIPSTPEYNFDATLNITSNQLTLAVELVDGECESPDYLWSTGEMSASIEITDLNSIYVVTVSCANNCEFVAFYQYTDGDCVINAPCNDDDPCTINDVFDNDCNCEGTSITEECDETDPCTNFIPCDDGNPCTYFDQVLCTEGTGNSVENDDSLPPCQGIYLNDDNGMPITDCDPDPCIVGAPCSDNDPCTINDTYDEICDCIGEQLLDQNNDPITDCDEINPCPASIEINVIPTNNYNEVLLSIVTSCDNVDTYLWSNGSGASSIIVPTQSGSYTAFITCGPCQYTITYDTDGCLVGLPCNDGLECTENDEVQENCECEGEPIEELEISFDEDEAFKSTCDYYACLPSLKGYSEFTISSVDVILPSGLPFQLNKGMNSQGFDFPYCYKYLPFDCTILPYAGVLAGDITNWLSAAGYAYIDGNISLIGLCNGGKTFKVINSSIIFTSINGYNEFGDHFSIPFVPNGNCVDGETPIGVNVEANIDCISYDDNGDVIPNEYQWSDGTTGSSIYIPYANNGQLSYCLEVTITCANGCTYSAIYGDNCESCEFPFYGAPCDDGNPCTIGDAADENCDCVGLVLADSDGDGVCDELDICPLGDDNIDLDEDGIPDACDDDVDCTGQYQLEGKITEVVNSEACVYCLVLNDPIFTDQENTAEIYLQSISVVNNGIPALLDASSNSSGFAFPYLVDKNSPLLLPETLTEGLNTYFGTNDFKISPTVDAVCFQNDDISGPNIFGSIKNPSAIKHMIFVWGGSNVVQKNFFYSAEVPCETLVPYTLTATLIPEDICGGQPSYNWSTGSSESSIQVPSMLPSYTVTITCGECETVVSTEPTVADCIVGIECEGLDICENTYDGFYDEFCNCISSSELPNYFDEDNDGIPDCIDCPSEFDQISGGVNICCDAPPAMIYVEAEEREIINYCMEFSDTDIITGVIIKGSTLDASHNDDEGDGYGEGNFFHFPYCIEDNCTIYNVDIDGDGNTDPPSGLKNIKNLAYDLQKWGVYKGYNFKPTTNFFDGSCTKCPTVGNLLYVNGMEKTYNPSGTIFNEHIKIIREDGVINNMKRCFGNVEGGYYIHFEEYIEENCKITKIEVQQQDMDNPIVDEDPSGINLGEYKFGPVPHMGVGFRATITVECNMGGETETCIYDIITPDADCIVGDPCDSPDVCASETYTTYDFVDCFCDVLASNDADGDGVCDDEDVCAGSNDNLDNDNDGIPNCLDNVCGAEKCTYTLDLASIACSEPEGDCMHISNITVLLPDGTEESLGKIPFFSESYDIGNACNGNQSDKLAKYIKRWFLNNGYIVGEVTVDDYVLTIIGSNIKFLDVENGCKDKIEFEEVCALNNLCIGPYWGEHLISHCEESNIYSIGILLPNNVEVKLDNSTTGFSFPYTTGYGDPASTNNWNPNFIDDLIQAYPSINIIYFADIEDNLAFMSNIIFLWIEAGCDAKTEIKPFECSVDVPTCDDGWDCTIGDHYDENCNCVGTFLDSDNDTVCNADDDCPGYSDLIDYNSNGIPDGCEVGVPIQCGDTEIPFCEYLTNVIGIITEEGDHTGDPNCYNGKLVQNNLILINEMLKAKFITDPNALNYLPFPTLKEQLLMPDGPNGDPTGKSYDGDNDGIVDILDPCLISKAYLEEDGATARDIGTHNLSDAFTIGCINSWCDNVKDLDEDQQAYAKERATLLNMFMFTVNPGVLAGTNADDSDPVYSPCFDDMKVELGLSDGDYNESGYVFSTVKGCYIYFELDCDCNCEVVVSEAINYDELCDPIVIGDQCTDNPEYDGVEGYFYVQCPPADPDPCLIYSLVGNSDYDVYDHEEAIANGDVYPHVQCLCWSQSMADSDGDGICDPFDECPGEPDVDIDGDGIVDCLDKCVDIAIDPQYTKEGYDAPGGPGDICDDLNPCTYDDVITEACECQGVYIDSDDDGVYDCEECEFVETSEGSGMYACDGCAGTVEVDEIGNVVDPTDPEANPIANTWTGCDVCPGIPDGDPEDIGGQYEGDLPMDYNDNGLPDCIDPPFKEVCPYEFEIANGVGLVLFFDTDDLDESDYPEPISFQGISIGNAELVYHDYLTVDYGREVVIEVEDESTGELIEKTITEVYYTIPYTSFERNEYDQATIIYSDHQICVITSNDIVPLPCPYSISIQYGKISFNQSDLGEIDLSELLGEYTIQSGGEVFTFNPNIATDFDITNSLIKLKIDPELLDVFSEDFTGSITLPSGLVCEFNSNEPEICVIEIEGGTADVLPGSPCDDEDECTHHDKYIDNGEDYCECIGEFKPDFDDDGFCDAIDPCPEDWNAMPASMKVEDIDDCPCPLLELDALVEENPVLENENDFYLHISSDLSGFSDLTIVIDNGQSDEPDEVSISPTSPLIISNLLGGYEYTITITAYCDNGEPQILTYTIDVPFGEAPIICGVELEPEELVNYILLSQLSVGEEFTASDFTVNVREVSGSYGKFTGKGYVSIPVFNMARMNVKFDNIIISEDRMMIDGYIEIDGFGLAILGDDISNAINDNLDGIISVLETIDDVLEYLIPILENIEDMVEAAGDLVDEETKQCLLDKAAELEILKIALEATNPTPTDEGLAQIKLDIERVAGELKICQIEFDSQIEDAIENMLLIMVPIINNLRDECFVIQPNELTLLESLQSTYDNQTGDLISEYQTKQTTLLQVLTEDVDLEISEILGNDVGVELDEYVSPVEEEVAPFDADLLIQANNFYEIENDYQYCQLMSSFNGNMTLDEVKNLLVIFFDVGEEFGSELKLKLSSGMSIDDIILETGDGNITDLMREYIKKTLQHKSYKNIKE